MSDYKVVNGKKVRVCKYQCNTELVWSDDISGFVETNGGVAHTKDRCEQIKESNKPQPKQEPKDREAKIAAIVKMIQSIIVNLEELKQK